MNDNHGHSNSTAAITDALRSRAAARRTTAVARHVGASSIGSPLLARSATAGGGGGGDEKLRRKKERRRKLREEERRMLGAERVDDFSAEVRLPTFCLLSG